MNTIFIVTLRCYLPFKFSFSHKYTEEFPISYMMCDKQVKCRIAMRIHLSSIKAGIKEAGKSAKQCHSSMCFWSWKIELFSHEYIIFDNM